VTEGGHFLYTITTIRNVVSRLTFRYANDFSHAWEPKKNVLLNNWKPCGTTPKVQAKKIVDAWEKLYPMEN